MSYHQTMLEQMQTEGFRFQRRAPTVRYGGNALMREPMQTESYRYPMGADIPYDLSHPCDPKTQYWDTNTGKCVPFASASSAAGGGTDWLKIGVIVGGGLLVAKMLKVF